MIYDRPGIIKYEVEVKEKSVVFGVLWQNSELTRTGDALLRLPPEKNTSGLGYSRFGVQSNLYPEIGPAGTNIYLRGSQRDRDGNRSSKTLGSELEAREFADKVCRSLEARCDLPAVRLAGQDWRTKNGIWTVEPRQLQLFE
jgi:hypothetical protein